MKRLLLLIVFVLIPLSAQAKLILGDTNDTLEVVTATAVSTINVHASWVDITTTAITPGMTNTLITLGAPTTTTVVAAPGASTQRQVKMLTIYNSHASSSNAISVQVNDGTTTAVLIKYTLLAGETLQWSEDENFRVIDASGQLKAAIDTEMPAAVALGDNTVNPTVPGVAAFLMCYDGSTWDRCQGGLTATDNNSVAAAQVPTLTLNIPYVYNGSAWVRQTGDATNGLDVDVTRVPTDPFGANADAAATAGSTGSMQAKLRTMTQQLEDIKTAVQLIDNDQTGATPVHYISTGSAGEDEHAVCTSACRIMSISATNVNAAVAYLRCANLTTASTTPGTSTVVYGLAVPGATTGGGFTQTFGPSGMAMSTAFTCWIVTGAAESDVAEVAANQVNVNYTYK